MAQFKENNILGITIYLFVFKNSKNYKNKFSALIVNTKYYLIKDV